jgi:hypothetical protein
LLWKSCGIANRVFPRGTPVLPPAHQSLAGTATHDAASGPDRRARRA